MTLKEQIRVCGECGETYTVRFKVENADSPNPNLTVEPESMGDHPYNCTEKENKCQKLENCFR